ncbi:zinc-binding dehydrogenase [Streptomyces violaceusniger]|uniref:zinc-binding dehydrogenase n=1 Tax=Streptomyces violaceusniger TaxID=68280 RepID=UPI000D0EA84F|nr:zinc-binding dehydrogenase [Streptomyces violaceusniger]
MATSARSPSNSYQLRWPLPHSKRCPRFGGSPLDAVVDTVGGDSLRGVAPLAAKPDALVSVGDLSVPELGGVFVHRRLDRSGLERVAALMVTGRLDPNITATYPLARAGEALALVESHHASGKLVIDMSL